MSHALSPGRLPPEAVRLVIHGEIRIGRWRPFRAEEFLHRDKGFVFQARVGRLISGSDSLIDGVGRASWKLCGFVPLMKASGPDIDRSAAGRWLAESLLLPSMLLPERGARWAGDAVTLSGFGERATINLELDGEGRLRGFRLPRWGNPGGAPFGYFPFGGVVEEERRFGGVLIPSRLRLGWHIGTPRWDKGEFFRMTVDEASFR
ncbi:MAG: hypothetical protein HY293_04260 [Planctomycetes bacterium]|nr:hypothetical protein [Planctomycetota bacterium]